MAFPWTPSDPWFLLAGSTSTQPATGGGLFGSTANTAAPATTGFGFGQQPQQTQAQPATTGFGFGELIVNRLSFDREYAYLNVFAYRCSANQHRRKRRWIVRSSNQHSAAADWRSFWTDQHHGTEALAFRSACSWNDNRHDRRPLRFDWCVASRRVLA